MILSKFQFEFILDDAPGANGDGKLHVGRTSVKEEKEYALFRSLSSLIELHYANILNSKLYSRVKCNFNNFKKLLQELKNLEFKPLCGISPLGFQYQWRQAGENNNPYQDISILLSGSFTMTLDKAAFNF